MKPRRRPWVWWVLWLGNGGFITAVSWQVWARFGWRPVACLAVATVVILGPLVVAARSAQRRDDA